MYRRCQLVKSHLKTTSWIPEPLGKVGETISLIDSDGIPSPGWQVIYAGEPRLSPPEYPVFLRLNTAISTHPVPN